MTNLPRPPRAPLIAPFRFATVEEGVMRGAHPSLKNFRFMRRLHLRTLVSLMPEPPASDLEQFCSAERIALKYHRVDKYDEGDVLSMSEPLVASLLTMLIDVTNHPVFVHCRDGGHNTGLLIMCLRRLQHWTTAVIHEEHRRYTKGNEIHYQEEQFLEGFSGPVAIPTKVPKWLWGGYRITVHPLIQLQVLPVLNPKKSSDPGGVEDFERASDGKACHQRVLQATRSSPEAEASQMLLDNLPSSKLPSRMSIWYEHLLEPSETLSTLATRPVASSTAPYSLELDGLCLAGLDLAPASSDRQAQRRRKPMQTAFAGHNANSRHIARQLSSSSWRSNW